MEKSDQNNHQLLIQKLLVSIHYLTLFRDEIILVKKMPSLLGASFSPHMIQSELGEILAAVDMLSKQERLIKSTFWYDESSFKLMNHSLDIVGNWVSGIDNVLDICESKSVFQSILGDNRPHVFGILIDVFTSLRITNLSIKEDSEYPVLKNPFQVIELQEKRLKKEALLAKFDALVPQGDNVLFEEEKKEEAENFVAVSKDEIVKLFRHYLFDNKENQVYVVDDQKELRKDIQFYNSFDRFRGVCENFSDILVLLEDVLDEMSNRPNLDPEEEIVEDPIYLIICGQNNLIEDSRFETLMSELSQFSSRPDLHILSYQAYN